MPSKKKVNCDLHRDKKTMPNAVSLPKLILDRLTKTEEDRLYAKYLLDSKGEFRLRHPYVIAALWKLIEDDVIAQLKEYDEQCGEKKKCEDGSCADEEDDE